MWKNQSLEKNKNLSDVPDKASARANLGITGGGGQTDTVAGSNGLQNTGNNVNANLSPVYGSSANTVCQGNDTRLHSQNTDQGTSAASFEINYTANSARLLTTGLTANRDYTLPDGATKLVGESVPATITAQHSFSPSVAQAPFALGANAQGQVVTGLNADTVDGSHASAFATSGHNHDATYAPIAKGVTNGDSHDHAGGDGAAISLTAGVTGTLPVANGGTGVTAATGTGNVVLSSSPTLVTPALGTPSSVTLTSGTGLPLTTGVTGTLPLTNGGTGQTTANAALNALLPSQTGKSGNILLTDGSNTAWTPFGRKNFANNGNFNIWQRNTVFTSVAGYTADRWYVDQSTDPDAFASRQPSGQTGFQYCARVGRSVSATTLSTVRLVQVLPTVESIPLQGKTVTFSFYAKAGANFSAAGSALLMEIYTGTGTDQSVYMGTWTGSINILGSNKTLTTSWQRFSASATLGAGITQVGIRLQYAPTGTAGADDWYEVTGVQLEIGSVATEFEVVSVQQELALCQRYYRKTFPYATAPAQNAGSAGALSLITPTGASGTVGYDWRFDPPMRGTPTITTYNPSAANANWRDATNSADRTVTTSTNLSETGCLVEGAATVAGAKHYIHATASAEL